jgi:hypothetical protein
MESNTDLYAFDIPDASGAEQAVAEKLCPGLQRFCPHFTKGVCDVKYSECVLLNSLKTSETLLRLERENLLADPTPKNLELVTQINNVLREKQPELGFDPVAIRRSKRKGRLLAALFFLIVLGLAVLIYLK